MIPVEVQMKAVRVWIVGGDGTEYYAAHSEEELRAFYIRMVGAEQAELDFADGLEEVQQADMEAEIEMDDDGEKRRTTWRKELEGAAIPSQISTGYN